MTLPPQTIRPPLDPITPLPSGSLTFLDSETTQTITVNVDGDFDAEADESFYVNLTNPSGTAVFADDQGLGTIENDDFATLTIDDVTMIEGDSGTSAFEFTVTRSIDTTGTTTVDFATADNTAVAGSDYTAASGSLTFNPGDTTQTITVNVTGDLDPEADESFYVDLSNASGSAIIADDEGIGTIQNDDFATFSIDDVSAAEGNAGTTGVYLHGHSIGRYQRDQLG